MRVTIEKVSSGAEGVWTSHIDPQSLLRLANPVRQGGHINIVLVSRPSYDNRDHSLQFDLDSAILLNLGNTSETIIIDSREGDVSLSTHDVQPNVQKQPAGDSRFFKELKQLPESLREVGEQLLKEVRKEFPGELVFHPKSGKFVESPDNFWVVRIQPRAQSFRIIVYGKPNEHSLKDTIELKRDMASYSSFVIDSKHQIHEAVELIREAKRLKDNK
jgi:hypothetical protein